MNEKSAPIITWFRGDLRLRDNPMLTAAAQSGFPIVPVYIFSPQTTDDLGSASRWWLHHAILDLRQQIKEQGGELLILNGDLIEKLEWLIEKTSAQAVFFNRCYEPSAIAAGAKVKERFKTAKSFAGNLLIEPWEITNKSGKPFQVFSAFWRALFPLLKEVKPSLVTPIIQFAKINLPSTPLEDLKLLPTIPWDRGFYEYWTPTRNAALKTLNKFAENIVANYATGRDIPGETGTSRLSPYLHFGQISPREIWEKICRQSEQNKTFSQGAETYLKELGWREFAYHLLYHFPHTITEPLKPYFKNFPWKLDQKLLKAWQKGATGYPIVDAGMRELWHTGWMHNRVRMIVASFLVKDLLIPWQEGAKWFWDTLLDADLASNTLGWQWTAGCGADAAPYFRVFNPTLQGKKFDPQGRYVRKWVPELATLPDEYLHAPWEAPSEALEKSGVQLGKNYPSPIVDHSEAKIMALEAFEQIKQTSASDL
ncbi:MAG TPA: deoxyribodipyrimidine photo-lyase [Oligoflexia bacterium]|nr:deoxyribodipyrimidine photo-lyase [Oligoflexia bacterium]HMP27297.1 deoxyribodipyrimidine photo-lyase [Oligoflexia bacterium]